jgi:aminotransferase
VDIRGTGLSAEDVCRVLLEEAGVAAIPGAAFGEFGKDFVRFSFASSVENLRDAVARIAKASTAWQQTLVGK